MPRNVKQSGGLSPDSTFTRETGLTASDSIITLDSTSSQTTIPSPSSSVSGIAYHDGSLFVSERSNDKVFELDQNGTVQQEYLVPSANPEGITTTSSGSFRLSHQNQSTITRLKPSENAFKRFETPVFRLTDRSSVDNPGGLGVESTGSIWLTDRSNESVYQFTQDGSLLTQFDSKIEQPRGLGVDTSGCLWISDRGGSGTKSVYQFTQTGSELTQFASASNDLMGVGLAPNDSVWVFDRAKSSIYQFDQTGTIQSAVSGPGVDDRGISVGPNGSLFVVNNNTERGAILTQSGNTVDSFRHGFTNAEGVGTDSSGSVWVYGNDDLGVYEVAPDLGLQSETSVQADSISDIHQTNAGSLWVTDKQFSTITKLNESKTPKPTSITNAGDIRGVGVDSTGSVWLSDSNGSDIKQYRDDGTLVSSFSAPSGDVEGVAVGTQDSIWFNGSSSTYKLTQTGSVIKSFDAPTSNLGGLGFGPDNSLYIASHDKNRLYKTNRDGIVSDQRFMQPQDTRGVGVDSSGSVFITDRGNNRIIITTEHFVPTTRLPTVSNDPTGVGIGPNGSVYLGSRSTNTVYKSGKDLGIEVQHDTQNRLKNYASTQVGGVVQQSDGSVWAVDSGSSQATLANSTGSVVTQFTSPSATPVGAAIDDADSIWLLNKDAQTISKHATNGDKIQFNSFTGITHNGSTVVGVTDTGFLAPISPSGSIQRLTRPSMFRVNSGTADTTSNSIFVTEQQAPDRKEHGNLSGSIVARTGLDSLETHHDTLGQFSVSNFDNRGIEFGPQNSVWVQSRNRCMYEVFHPRRETIESYYGLLNDYAGVAYDNDDCLWTLDLNSRTLHQHVNRALPERIGKQVRDDKLDMAGDIDGSILAPDSGLDSLIVYNQDGEELSRLSLINNEILGLAVTEDNCLWYSDGSNSSIFRVSRENTTTSTQRFSSPSGSPQGIGYNTNTECLYHYDRNANTVFQLDKNGGVTRQQSTTNAGRGVAVGPQHCVFVADRGSIFRFTETLSPQSVYRTRRLHAVGTAPTGSLFAFDRNDCFIAAGRAGTGDAFGVTDRYKPITNRSRAIAVDNQNSLWQSEGRDNSIVELNRNRLPRTEPHRVRSIIGNDVRGWAFSDEGCLWINSADQNSVFQLNRSFRIQSQFSVSEARHGIAVDSNGSLAFPHDPAPSQGREHLEIFTQDGTPQVRLTTEFSGTNRRRLAFDKDDSLWIYNFGDRDISQVAPGNGEFADTNPTSTVTNFSFRDPPGGTVNTNNHVRGLGIDPETQSVFASSRFSLYEFNHSGSLVEKYKHHGRDVRAMATSPDGCLFVYDTNTRIAHNRVFASTVNTTIESPSNATAGLSFTEDDCLWASSFNNSIYRLDKTGAITSVIEQPFDDVGGITTAYDSTLLVSSNNARSISHITQSGETASPTDNAFRGATHTSVARVGNEDTQPQSLVIADSDNGTKLTNTNESLPTNFASFLQGNHQFFDFGFTDDGCVWAADDNQLDRIDQRFDNARRVHSIYKLDKTGEKVTAFSFIESFRPRGITETKTDSILVATRQNDLFFYSPDGTLSRRESPSGGDLIGATQTSDGCYWLADNSIGRVFKSNNQMNVRQSFSLPSNSPRGLGNDSNGCLWTLDVNNQNDASQSIYQIDQNGTVVDKLEASIYPGKLKEVADSLTAPSPSYRQASRYRSAADGLSVGNDDSLWLSRARFNPSIAVKLDQRGSFVPQPDLSGDGTLGVTPTDPSTDGTVFTVENNSQGSVTILSESAKRQVPRNLDVDDVGGITLGSGNLFLLDSSNDEIHRLQNSNPDAINFSSQ